MSTHTISLTPYHYTIHFTAPTDAAFAALDEETVAALSADTDLLTSVLLGHVVNGAVKSSDLSNGQMVQTLNEEMKITVTKGAGVGSLGIVLNTDRNSDVDVIAANIMACNGYIHAIDQVLLPPDPPEPEPGCPEDPGSIVDVAVGAAPEFSILVDLVVRAGLDSVLSNLAIESTVFGE